jgi:hypothetical protein
MILEAECYSSSCRGRVVAIVHLPRGGDEWSGEGGGGVNLHDDRK